MICGSIFLHEYIALFAPQSCSSQRCLPLWQLDLYEGACHSELETLNHTLNFSEIRFVALEVFALKEAWCQCRRLLTIARAIPISQAVLTVLALDSPWILILHTRSVTCALESASKSQLGLVLRPLFHGDIWIMDVLSSVRIWSYLLHGAVVYRGVYLYENMTSVEERRGWRFFSTEAMGDRSLMFCPNQQNPNIPLFSIRILTSWRFYADI